MIMNKKGFTLVELLATMVILALIASVAIPNVVKIMSNNKKGKVINDGMTLIAQAKKKISSDYDLRESINEVGVNYSLDVLDNYNDIINDPDGVTYNRANSYVKIYKVDNTVTYCVYLESDNWILKNASSCVLENELLSDNSKKYVNEN